MVDVSRDGGESVIEPLVITDQSQSSQGIEADVVFTEDTDLLSIPLIWQPVDRVNDSKFTCSTRRISHRTIHFLSDI